MRELSPLQSRLIVVALFALGIISVFVVTVVLRPGYITPTGTALNTTPTTGYPNWKLSCDYDSVDSGVRMVGKILMSPPNMYLRTIAQTAAVNITIEMIINGEDVYTRSDVAENWQHTKTKFISGIPNSDISIDSIMRGNVTAIKTSIEKNNGIKCVQPISIDNKFFKLPENAVVDEVQA